MLDKIAINLERECNLQASDLLLVGVSGGPDSLCLLHAIRALRYHVITAHVNHGLRPEADQEAQVVKQYAGQFEVDFILCQLDVRSYAGEHSISIEEAARTMRYNYLFEQAEKLGASAVLVGHNADDQVETILMHLLRGSGLAGLRGMEYRSVPNAWSEHIPLVRPLLSIWRVDILKYLAEHELNPISDESNLDTTYFRNRLRHELLPTLEVYNPRIRENLYRVGQITRDDYAVLQQLTTEAWNKCLVKQGPGYLAFQLINFRELSLSIQRYLLRKAIGYHLPGLRDVEYECIERGLGFVCGDKANGQVDLISGVRIIKDGKVFWLATWQADLPGSDHPAVADGAELILNIPGTLSLNSNWNLQAIVEPEPEMAIQKSYANLNLYEAWLDVGALVLPIIVRCRKYGERIQLLGMNGHSMKISDLMVNLKLPKRARSTWPLVCSGDDILWIPGYRLSFLARIKPDSRSIVHLTLFKDSST